MSEQNIKNDLAEHEFQSEGLTAEEVWEKELSPIAIRRVQAYRAVGESSESDTESPEDESGVREGLIGLSLSGGGIRSASFTLGFTDALYRSGLFRHCDYISGVSGGSYTAAFITAQANRSKEGLNQTHTPFNVLSNPQREIDCDNQPLRIRQLIYGGDYLFKRKADFFSTYTAGLLATNAVLFSGLVALAALIALLWRSLDTEIAKSVLTFLSPEDHSNVIPIDWAHEDMRAFIPAILFGVVWIACWDAHLNSVKSGSQSKRGLWFAYAATCVLVVTLIFADIRPLAPFFLAGPAWLLCLSLSKLTPAHRSRSHVIWFGLMAASILIGVAVWLGNHGVARTSAHWDPWVLFLPWLVVALCSLPVLRPKALVESATQTGSATRRYIFLATSTAILAGIPLFFVYVIAEEDFSRHFGKGMSERTRFAPSVDFIDAEELVRSIDREADLGDQPVNVSALLKRALVTHTNDDKSKANPGNKLIKQILDSNDPPSKRMDEDKLKTLKIALATILTNLTPAELIDPLANSSPEDFINGLGMRRYELGVQSVLLEAPENLASTQQFYDEFLSRNQEKLRCLLQINAASTEELSEGNEKELKRLVLEAWYPRFIKTRLPISRKLVIGTDQFWRFVVFSVAVATFFALAWSISPNLTSIHRFYAERLTRAYLTDETGKNAPPPLHEINPTTKGAPYLLISGTTNLFDPLFNVDDIVPDSVKKRLSGLFPSTQRDQSEGSLTLLQENHRLETFVLSQLYCGSETIRYRQTKEFDEGVTLGDAIAVSGAAFSPLIIDNHLLFALMTILNLRLGQWCPNPRVQKNRTRPTFLSVFWGMFRPARERRNCFVSDGGHRENLGIIALLLRRCRLIFASDAGCDPSHRFDDLARVIRTARVHLGIRFWELDENGQRTGRELQTALLDLHSLSKQVRETNVNETEETDGHEEQSRTTRRDESAYTHEHFIAAEFEYPYEFFYGRSESGQVDSEDILRRRGLLIYAKPSFTGDESADLRQYRSMNPDFPHETTADQNYDADRFEAYRSLGYHIGQSVGQRFLSPKKAGRDLWRPELRSADDLIGWFREQNSDTPDQVRETLELAVDIVSVAESSSKDLVIALNCISELANEAPPDFADIPDLMSKIQQHCLHDDSAVSSAADRALRVMRFETVSVDTTS